MSDDGEFTELDSVANNANAEMPRGHKSRIESYGEHYNWYAATAESGKYDMAPLASSTSSDSICPSGWQLATSSGNESWGRLLGTYSISSGTSTENVNAIKGLPFILSFSGTYGSLDGVEKYLGTSGHYWTSVASNTATSTTAFHLYFDASGGLYAAGASGKMTGFTIRCVKK